MQKIAIVSHSHPSISKGGAEISAYALFRGLREIGHDAIFIAACSSTDRHRFAPASEHEYAIYFDHARYSHFFHLADQDLERQLSGLLQIHEVGIVNFHHFISIGLNTLRAVKRRLGLRCYFTIHEFLAICHHHGQMVTRPQQLLCSQDSPEACGTCFPEYSRSEFVVRKNRILDSIGDFDGFISPSHFLAERFRTWGLDPSRLVVIENGLLRKAERKPMLSSVSPPARASRCVIGFFGQINPFKGVDVMLAAAELIAADKDLALRIELRIHGNLIGQSEEFIKRFDAAVQRLPFLSFAGPYNSAVVEELMSACDYILVPSRWWENSPVVIQEAYSVGVPVICTGIGGLAEKVPHRVSGLHFKRGDARDLVDVMRQAIQPELHDRLRKGVPAADNAAVMAAHYARFMGLQSEPAIDADARSGQAAA